MEVGPGRFPGPLLGHVQCQAAGGACEPGGDVDQVSTDCGSGGAGVERAGQGTEGAGEVMRDRPQHRPGCVRCERSRGQVASALATASAMTCSMIA